MTSPLRPARATTSSRPSSTLAVAALVVSLLACSAPTAGPNMYGFSPEELKAQDDKAKIDELSTQYNKLLKWPGAANFVEYVDTACEAYVDGVFERTPSMTPDLTEPLEIADNLLVNAPHTSHTVEAYRGDLLVCAGRVSEAQAAWMRSIAYKPNLVAGSHLAMLYGRQGNFKSMGETCAQVTPYLSGDERWEMMDTCREYSQATDDASAFFWASPDDLAFWQEESRRREVLRQQQAAEAARQRQLQAERERQRREEQYRINQEQQRQQNRVDSCLSTCEERAYSCASRCYGNEQCRSDCNEAYRACQNRCHINNR